MTAYPSLPWLEGIGAAERKDFGRAEKALRKASSGFQELGDFVSSAAVTLELAIILSCQGRPTEVVEVARAALPILQELELDDECLVLIGLLEKAIQERNIESALLWRLRSRLGAELGRSRGL